MSRRFGYKHGAPPELSPFDARPYSTENSEEPLWDIWMPAVSRFRLILVFAGLILLSPGSSALLRL